MLPHGGLKNGLQDVPTEPALFVKTVGDLEMRPAEIEWVLRAITDALTIEIKDRDCRNAARS